MAWETYKMVIGSNGLGVILYSVLFCFLVPANSAVDPYQVSEQVPPGTYVGNISADFDLRSMTTLEEFNKLVYSIFASENDFGSFFRITQETGVLYTTDAIDRDSIPQCARIEQCILTLDIGVQSTLGAFFRKIQVEILVSDLNDNSPQFLNTIDTAQFSENSIDGTTASITGAQDKDAGNNSIVRYYIETPNVPFDVIMESNPDGSSLATLVVKGELDREKQSFYELKVVAEDGGVPKRTGTVDVNVTILDVNDNDPVFDKPFYNVTLKEDISLNEIFETVRATDADAGENGRVEYRMSANTDSDIAKLFAINATSGELRVIGQLVYIHNEQMRVYIEASDQGLQRRFSQVVVYINILDSSNNPPQIKLNILKGDDVNKIARVSEYANIGAVIAYITVSDDDTGRNGEVVCISLSDMFETERYANKEYKTVVLEPLNRELFEVHEVTIVCRDNGAPAMNTSVTFTVEVEDENDNSPRFSQVNYYANSAENNRVGDVVARVRATDADTGNNSKIEYSLVDSGGYDFWMDPVSGEIRANFVLDRENISKIVLEVIAGDFGSPRLTSTTLVTLTITDVNDNYPIFSQPNYEFIVNEGDAVNTTVDQLTATDQDFGSNGSVTFNFSSPPPKDYPFMLFSDGTLKMIRGLDREVQSKYEFMVVAADGGSPSLSSSVTVTIAVYDVNDNPPVFLFPDDSNNTATIPLSNPPDKVSIIIKASDNDEGVNSVLSYQILDKNVSELFIMESKNGYGVIKLHRLPGPSEALRYRLRLLAEDHGTPRQSSIKTLNVVFIKDSPSDSTKHNFLIAITLGCVTVVISIAIVIIICLIRRHDKLKNKDCSACAFNEKADLEIVPVETKINMHALNGSQSSGSRESLKKVSFSTDFNCSADSDNSVRDLTGTLLVTHDTFKMDNSSVPRSFQCPPSNSSTSSDQDIQKLDPVTVLNIHKSLLQSRDQLWANQRDGHTPPLTSDLLKPPGDNDSESSGETATCDSGRGGSESDIQTSYSQSHDTDHIKTVTFANKPMLHHFPVESHDGWDNRKDLLHNSSHRYNHTNHNPYKINPKSDLTFPARDYLISPNRGTSSHSKIQVPFPGHGEYKHYPVPKDHMTARPSYDDDDDTTTSGSYTIDNDDWMNDSQSHPYRSNLSPNEAYC